MRCPSVPGLILLGALCAHGAAAQDIARHEPDGAWSALLIDPTLSATRVSVVELDSDGIVFLDDAGRRTRSTISSIMALLPTPDDTDASQGIGAVGTGPRTASTDAAPTGYVELTDGQTFPGQYVPTSAGEDSIIWHHPQFGDIEFPLDNIRWIVRDAQADQAVRALPDAPLEDELILVNGDRIRGFIIGLGDPVEIESGEGVIKLDMQRVSGAVFSNPGERPTGLIVWLSDGTTARVEPGVQMTSNELTVSLSDGQPAIYDISELRAVAFDAGRIVPLSSLRPDDSEAVGERLFAPPTELRPHPSDEGMDGPPALGARDIFIPGPMHLEYELPENAMRLSGTASLADGTAPWGDCELVLHVDGQEVYRRRLTSDQPAAPFNIELRGRRLGVSVLPGDYGPILDLVYLRRALILLDKPGGS